MKRVVFVILFCFLFSVIMGQSKVAITIDDVPNTRKYKLDNYKSELYGKLNTLAIPVAIFINERKIHKVGDYEKNLELLETWLQNENVTPANHTYGHQRYSEIDSATFVLELNQGEQLSKALAKKYGKDLRYFRFPYNDLGKDRSQQELAKGILYEHKYILTPFTIESSDWMFNYVYEYYIKKGDRQEAEKIGQLYIEKTLEYVAFFDSIAKVQYGRYIHQIYLCHDNAINAVYLDQVLQKLQAKGHEFVSLEEAMQDKVYQQTNYYHKKWGISWIYRWISDKKSRQTIMNQEPDMSYIYQLYKEIEASKSQ